MAAKHALTVLETISDLFAQMAASAAIDLQIKEIVHPLHLLQSSSSWNFDKARARIRLRARIAYYASHYRTNGICPMTCAGDFACLDEIRATSLDLRCHLLVDIEQQIAR